MYKIRTDPGIEKKFRELKTSYKIAVGLIFEELKENPYLGKPLEREFIGKYSYRIGVYRIIYKIDETNKAVVILNIDHRSVVYN